MKAREATNFLQTAPQQGTSALTASRSEVGSNKQAPYPREPGFSYASDLPGHSRLRILFLMAIETTRGLPAPLRPPPDQSLPPARPVPSLSVPFSVFSAGRHLSVLKVTPTPTAPVAGLPGVRTWLSDHPFLPLWGPRTQVYVAPSAFGPANQQLT